jgi:hypothetical protein
MKLLDKQENVIEDTIDLGIVEAGKSKEYTYYLYNDIADEIVDISMEIEHPEVEVVKVPSNLGVKGKDSLTIRWSPSLTVKKGLKVAFKIKATELYK